MNVPDTSSALSPLTDQCPRRTAERLIVRRKVPGFGQCVAGPFALDRLSQEHGLAVARPARPRR